MALTRKDFNAIARQLAFVCQEAREDHDRATARGDHDRAAKTSVALSYLSSAVARVGKGLSETNPNFDPDRFRDAVWHRKQKA